MTTKRVLKILAGLFGVLFLATGIAAAALPGPHKAFVATHYGFEEIAPQIFAHRQTSENSRRQIMSDIETGRMKAIEFFGALKSDPRILICLGIDCNPILGDAPRPRGLAYNHHLILLSDKGIDPIISTHEIFHTELHQRIGSLGFLLGRFPAWFDEGLATLKSGDKRYADHYSNADLAWARTAKTFRDWPRLIEESGGDWRRLYGSSRQLVFEIETKLGRDGLRNLISAVVSGEDFDTALSERLTKSE